jgi:phosphoadenosine phosphosulfate reductase
MLNESDLWGQRDKIAIAMARIREFEAAALQIDPAGYYVCVSGGKDSSVITELCVMAGVKCEFVHNHTSVDHPETVYFIRQEQERLQSMGCIFRVEYPRDRYGKQKTMWNLIPKKGLPIKLQRWCCVDLKEYGGVGRYCITGVRWQESTNRKSNRGLHEDSGKNRKEQHIILNNDNDMKRRLVESCIPKRKFVLNPIIDWSEIDVWDFIKMRGIPYNPLYKQGHKRVGCIGCPIVYNRRNQEFAENPKYRDAYFRAARNHIDYRKTRGLPLTCFYKDTETYFDWWCCVKNNDDYGLELFNEQMVEL